jgi:hypothetical protein
MTAGAGAAEAEAVVTAPSPAITYPIVRPRDNADLSRLSATCPLDFAPAYGVS